MGFNRVGILGVPGMPGATLLSALKEPSASRGPCFTTELNSPSVLDTAPSRDLSLGSGGAMPDQFPGVAGRRFMGF